MLHLVILRTREMDSGARQWDILLVSDLREFFAQLENVSPLEALDRAEKEIKERTVRLT